MQRAAELPAWRLGQTVHVLLLGTVEDKVGLFGSNYHRSIC